MRRSLHSARPPPPRARLQSSAFYSMMRLFLRSCPTVSEGCAPLASHALMAGAFRLDCFAMGSYQPSSCECETDEGSGVSYWEAASGGAGSSGRWEGGRARPAFWRGGVRTSRGAPSRRLRESIAMMR